VIIGPVEEDLKAAKAKTLMWSLDDVLRYVPIAALHDGHHYLVETYRNEVFTEANTTRLIAPLGAKSWRMLGMGLSKTYGEFPPLPSVPEELHGIIRSGEQHTRGVVPGELMLDEEFTQQHMEKGLEGSFPLVHIASHFSFQPGDDRNSFLLLGGDPQKVGGEHLTLAEINNNPNITFRGVELLTLSACNTAMSSAADGREVDGLGKIAERKGARAVLASLWPVYDASTAALMQEFYGVWTAHPGLPKAEALRRAQVFLLRGGSSGRAGPSSETRAAMRYAHPFYWAPFILLSNWR
jgi:CHAT domain-containing protein